MPYPALGGEAEAEAARDLVRRYHERTKHQLRRYAAGPETLDWDAQPSPFRRFVGAATVALPHVTACTGPLADALARPLGARRAGALPFSLATLGALFELSLGITAWKSLGPDRWAVRANPSSGNLHPVEGYALLLGADFIEAGVYHYAADGHVLEQRARWLTETASQPRLWLALSSVMWREVWKYGERAFRYCQLDVGHALAALGYAAALMGWRLYDASWLGWSSLSRALGLDRVEDFAPLARRDETETEEAELIVELVREGERGRAEGGGLAELIRQLPSAVFAGKATVVDAHPMYSWPCIRDVARATRWAGEGNRRIDLDETEPGPGSPRASKPAAELILSRRSAQRFDPRFVLGRAGFEQILAAVGSASNSPLATLLERSAIDLVLFVHRVEGFESGVYLLARTRPFDSSAAAQLVAKFGSRAVRCLESELELFELARVAPRELSRTARSLCCHQEIAASSCFVIAMVADVEQCLRAGASAYRGVHREAGALGQALYLAAEAAGVRGTGIGCFFDDPTAEFLGVADTGVRSVYHFSIGKPIDDPRIETNPHDVSERSNE